MYLEDEITFEHGIPSSNDILQKVKEKSGLSDLLLVNRNNKFEVFSHSLFDDLYSFHILKETNKICLTRGWNNRNYLLEITVSSLLELGGTYRGELREWTNEKWEKVKGNF